MKEFFGVGGMGDMFRILLGATAEPQDTGSLGEGCRLVRIDDGNKMQYSHLYKEEVKISDMVFRKGGLGGKFDSGYCCLLSYPDYKKDGKDTSGWGNWCIVDTDGSIVIEVGQFGHLYHSKGVIASVALKLDGCQYDSKYQYNLKTKTVICPDGSSVDSSKFLFVRTSYLSDDQKKYFKPGVYKIEYATGEYEIFD